MHITETTVRDALRALPGGPAREYALAHAGAIAAKFHEQGLRECEELTAMENGADLVELYVDYGEGYGVVGAGCSARANFGGEGVHWRTAPKTECVVC